MTHVETAIVAANTVTLVLGSLIAYFAFKAYRRTGAAALRALAIGFSVITLGAVAAGAVDFVVPRAGLLEGVLVHSATTMVGFLFIAYSLYVE
jgi:hypothetical protein